MRLAQADGVVNSGPQHLNKRRTDYAEEQANEWNRSLDAVDRF
jgi:hypothetical protein